MMNQYYILTLHKLVIKIILICFIILLIINIR
jgi:hypothetical protein